MSIDIDWNAITAGSDGLALAETIRAFVHDKFQQVPLPRFIRAVKVHGFEFGTLVPKVELKDVCDPLDDFYEEDEDDDEDEEDGSRSGSRSGTLQDKSWEGAAKGMGDPRLTSSAQHPRSVDGSSDPRFASHERDVDAFRDRRALANLVRNSRPSHQPPSYIDTRIPGLRSTLAPGEQLGSPIGPRSSTPTPGIPGGTSSLSYFHLPLGGGLSGTSTPLTAIAGAHFHSGWPEDGSGLFPQTPAQSESTVLAGTPSISSVTPPSTADPASRPMSQHHEETSATSAMHAGLRPDPEGQTTADFDGLPHQQQHLPRFRERSPQDLQIVAHVTYSGDVKMSLTAELLLDYPMENFVGIPLKLNITGLSFNGVAILAYIRRRAHFCFLSPEDADILVGTPDATGPDSIDDDDHGAEAQAPAADAGDQHGPSQRRSPAGGLLKQIHVESEIGDRENGKQVLKNVGKVEKFVLEQVRHIFEDEFVYPSYWTFLV